MRIHKILSLAGLAGLMSLAACFDEPGANTTIDAKIVSFNVTSKTLLENNAAGIDAMLEFTKAPEAGMTVTYEVAATNAVAGVDYTIETPSPVTVPAGAFSVPIKIKAINNNVFEPLTRTIKLTITAISDANYAIQANKSYTVTLINDDCPANTSVWFGTIGLVDVGDNDGSPRGATGEGTGKCNELFVSADFVGWGSPSSTKMKIAFTPSSVGATKGTAVVVKYDYMQAGAAYKYEATGTYDETTKLITLNYKYYRVDGSLWFTGTNIISK